MADTGAALVVILNAMRILGWQRGPLAPVQQAAIRATAG